MPVNKNYDLRKRLMNEAFRTRFFTVGELVERVSDRLGDEVSEKTIEDTIKHMRAEGAPIINKRGRGYIYEPKNFNLFEVKASPDSIGKMKQAAAILKQIPGLDLHEDLKEIFERLEMRLKGEGEDEISHIQFDTRPMYEGRKYLSELLEAIIGQTVVSFKYKPFYAEEPSDVVLHPYLLKEYNNRWFVMGLTEIFRQKKEYKIFSFGLERIKSRIKPEVAIEYYYHHKFNPETYYNDIIGVTLNDGCEIQNVILKFSDTRAPYVETNPLHYSQTKVSGIPNTFQYKLILNKELESLILSYGPDAEVIQPEELKNKIASLVLENSKTYSE